MEKISSVFLIEDDEDDRLFFTEALKQIKNAVLYNVAVNGKEALEILEKATVLPSFIFSDIHMPKMDGMECFNRILSSPRIKDIPVVFLSSDMDKSDVVRKLGARAFIKKPADGSLLRRQIEETINRNILLESEVEN
jgi:CheY-like chemotaxis protein